MSAHISPSSPGLQHLEFQHTVEGVLVRTLGKDLTPELKARLREEGIDLDQPLKPAYPAGGFHRCIRLAATHIWPGVVPEEAVRRLGERVIGGLSETMMGRATRMMLSVLGPKRGLQRATRAFRTNNNYTDVKVNELAPTSVELTFNDVHGLPTYYQGVLESIMKMFGTHYATVRLLDSPPPTARYLVEWKE